MIKHNRDIRLDELVDDAIIRGRVHGMSGDAPDIIYTSTMNFHPEPRPMIRYIRSVYGDKSIVGAEIGVMAGVNAVSILSNLNISKLYLVDPYVVFSNSYYDLPNLNNILREALRLAVYNMLPYGDKIHWMHLPSFHAYNYMEPLDFIYIDAAHSYDEVLEDCRILWPLVKEGGLIGGHDWSASEVDKAVKEFASEIGLNVSCEKTDWWIRKG